MSEVQDVGCQTRSLLGEKLLCQKWSRKPVGWESETVLLPGVFVGLCFIFEFFLYHNRMFWLVSTEVWVQVKSPTAKHPHYHCHVIPNVTWMWCNEWSCCQRSWKAVVVSGEMHHGAPGLRGNLTDSEWINREVDATKRRDLSSPPLFNSKNAFLGFVWGILQSQSSDNPTVWWWNVPWRCRVCNAWPEPPGCASMIYLKWQQQLT